MNEVTTISPVTHIEPMLETVGVGEFVTSLPLDNPESRSLTAWLFPGLGCRYVGMGYDLIGRFAVADELIATAQSRLSYSIREVCLEGSGRKIVPARQEAQVIYILDCAYAAVLREHGNRPGIIAGHSLGNLAAAYVAGAYDFVTGLDLVTRIEALMEELADGRDQAMGVVIGLDEVSIRGLLQATPGTYLANWNSPLQHVIGGSASGVDQVLHQAAGRGAKQAKRIGAGRAMHTPLMDEVQTRFREDLAAVEWNEPGVPFVNSHDATTLHSAAEIRQFLGSFLSQPVHWQLTVRAILQGWGSHFVEVGPGTVLTSMLPFIESTATVRTASDVLDQKVQL